MREMHNGNNRFLLLNNIDRIGNTGKYRSQVAGTHKMYGVLFREVMYDFVIMFHCQFFFPFRQGLTTDHTHTGILAYTHRHTHTNSLSLSFLLPYLPIHSASFEGNFPFSYFKSLLFQMKLVLCYYNSPFT